MKVIIQFLNRCNLAFSSPIGVFSRYVFYRIFGKKILASSGSTIVGVKNIYIKDILFIGFNYVGFSSKRDVTVLNIRGQLLVNGRLYIGRGCRLDIGPGASVEIESGYINPFTYIVASNCIKIGSDCAISWGCQILDNDFHSINYPSQRSKKSQVLIGDHVLIGSNCSILAGSVIPDGCVVASGTVVSSEFSEKNALIAGSPARVVKRDVTWS